MESHPIGTRVLSRLNQQPAVLIGLPEQDRIERYLVTVQLEGSTRREVWATHQTVIRPRHEQFVALGGKVKAPAGFPLVGICDHAAAAEAR